MTYLLFGGETFYPCGGVGDFLGVFDEPEQAKKHFDVLAKIPYDPLADKKRVRMQWGEIAVLEDGDYFADGCLTVKMVYGQPFGWRWNSPGKWTEL